MNVDQYEIIQPIQTPVECNTVTIDTDDALSEREKKEKKTFKEYLLLA